MSPEAKAADHVYRRLKTDVVAGAYAPSTVLNVHEIATDVGVSVSPVRDAVERLVGERLLLPRVGGGFQIPPIDEATVRDLYHWHGQLTRWAVSTGRVIRLPDTLRVATRVDTWENNEAIVKATSGIFQAIGATSGSAEHAHALQSASDRLYALRLHEGNIIRDRGSEIARLIDLTLPGRESLLRTAISHYHRRRIRVVSALLRRVGSQKSA